jgi:hypothetical protein
MYLSLSAQRGSLLNLEGANREESTGAHPPELTFRGFSQNTQPGAQRAKRALISRTIDPFLVWRIFDHCSSSPGPKIVPAEIQATRVPVCDVS